MTEHFNKLTPAEAERLAMLAEECAEVIQIVGKILRHGYTSYHPSEPTVTNRDLLIEELVDLQAVTNVMRLSGDVPTPSTMEVWHAIKRKKRFTHHQEPTVG